MAETASVPGVSEEKKWKPTANVPVMSEERKWKLRAAEQQQTFHVLFKQRKWFRISATDPDRDEIIAQKIAFALRGSRTSECDAIKEQDVRFIVDKIYDIGKDSEGSSSLSSYSFNFTYISTWDGVHDGIVSVVRVLGDKETWFVDSNDRYPSWEEYLKRNKLSDDLQMCFPKGGFYDQLSHLVDVQYAERGTLKERTVIKQIGTLKPAPSWWFFPLYKPFFNYVFKYESNLILITIKRTGIDVESYTNAHSLAMWFEMIIGNYGKKEKQEPADITVLTIEIAKARRAMEVFRSFYESPYSVHGFFMVVYLMKMIAGRHVNRSNSADECKNFSEMLEFLLNVSVPKSLIEPLIVTLIEDFSFANLFKFPSRNTSFEETKNVCEVTEIPDVLELMAKREVHDDLTGTAKLRELIIELNDMVETRREGINAGSVKNLVSEKVSRCFGGVPEPFVKERRARESYVKDRLPKNSNINLGEGEDFSTVAINALYNCFEKIDAGFPSEEPAKSEFLKFCVRFGEHTYIDNEDVFDFMIGKFMSNLIAFVIEYKARTNSVPENVFDMFFDWFEQTPFVNEYPEECEKMNRIFKKGDSIYLFDYKGVSVYGIRSTLLAPSFRCYSTNCETLNIETKLISFFFNYDPYEKMVCEYLGTGALPRKSDCHLDDTVWMHSNNGKFFICAPFKPSIKSVLKYSDYLGFAGIILMFEVLPNPLVSPMPAKPPKPSKPPKPPKPPMPPNQ